jgi:hypothetical protein
MNCMKQILALGLALTVTLTDHGMSQASAADELGDRLTPADILNEAQKRYASLGSYSDEGETVSTSHGVTTTTTFWIKMEKPCRYRVEWTQMTASQAKTTTTRPQAVWSVGQGDFLDMGNGPVWQKNRDMALATATGISGGAAATVPGALFNLQWDNQLSVRPNIQRMPDEKVGDMDCYVLTDETKGWTRTLWIGKQDFFIHQLRRSADAAAVKAALEEAIKAQPEIAASLPNKEPQAIISTETHTKIVVNIMFTEFDFNPPR